MSFSGTAAVADAWDRTEAPGVHVAFVATETAFLSVVCFAPESETPSGLGLRVTGLTEGPARVRVDDRPPREFVLVDGTFELSDAAGVRLFEALVADLRAGAVAVVEVGGARATLPLSGSARAIGACPATF